jgi:hypothetical protein
VKNPDGIYSLIDKLRGKTFVENASPKRIQIGDSEKPEDLTNPAIELQEQNALKKV